MVPFGCCSYGSGDPYLLRQTPDGGAELVRVCHDDCSIAVVTDLDSFFRDATVKGAQLD